MSTADVQGVDVSPGDVGVFCPLSLSVEPIASLLNLELADDAVYDSLELQWFDDEVHGTGMLALLSRRAGRRVDYYPQRGLRLDREGYELGGGTGSWTDTDFEVARLEVVDDGVDAEAVFTDIDGRRVEIRIDDRDGRRRRRARLLAPVSAGTERPAGLLLVWMPGFDLVRMTGSRPVVRVGGREASTGRLPGARLHRRRLIKYAAPVCAVELNRNRDGPHAGAHPGQRLEYTADRSGIAAVGAEAGGHRAWVACDPPLPDVAALADGAVQRGGWHIGVDGVRLTAGRWRVARRGDQVELGLDVTEPWRPGRLPWLLRLVTTLAPVFRRWPTTYRWRARVTLGPAPAMTSRWERLPCDKGQRYRRATRS